MQMPYNYKKQNGGLMLMSQGEKFIHQSPVNDELSALIKLLTRKLTVVIIVLISIKKN